MSNAKRVLEARRRYRSKPEPFAWMPGGLLVSQSVCSLSGQALAVFLLLNANWIPPASGRSHGKAILPYGKAVKIAHCGRTAIAQAFRDLQEHALILLLKPGTRPRHAGAARGEAAEWRLPFRERGEHPRLTLPPNVRRPEGKVAWNVNLIRHDVANLSDPALKVLVYVVGRPDRNHDSGLASIAPFVLPIRPLADLLGFSSGTAHAALRELIATKRLILAQPSSGRRPALYALANTYIRHQRSLNTNRGNEPAVPEARSQHRTQRYLSGPGPERKPVAFTAGTEEHQNQVPLRSMTGLLVDTMEGNVAELRGAYMDRYVGSIQTQAASQDVNGGTAAIAGIDRPGSKVARDDSQGGRR